MIELKDDAIGYRYWIDSTLDKCRQSDGRVHPTEKACQLALELELHGGNWEDWIDCGIVTLKYGLQWRDDNKQGLIHGTEKGILTDMILFIDQFARENCFSDEVTEDLGYRVLDSILEVTTNKGD